MLAYCGVNLHTYNFTNVYLVNESAFFGTILLLIIPLLLADACLLYEYFCIRQYSFGREKYVESLFGIPIVARLPNVSCGYDICREFLKLINPFLMSAEDVLDEYDNDDDVDNKVSKDNELDDATSSGDLESDSDSDLEADFKFYLPATNMKIKMNKPLPFTVLPKRLEVAVLWSDKMIKKYDTCLLSSLPEVFKLQLFTKRTPESVSVYKCLEAFLKEEPLGPEDMWLVDILSLFIHLFMFYELLYL